MLYGHKRTVREIYARWSALNPELSVGLETRPLPNLGVSSTQVWTQTV